MYINEPATQESLGNGAGEWEGFFFFIIYPEEGEMVQWLKTQDLHHLRKLA